MLHPRFRSTPHVDKGIEWAFQEGITFFTLPLTPYTLLFELRRPSKHFTGHSLQQDTILSSSEALCALRLRSRPLEARAGVNIKRRRLLILGLQTKQPTAWTGLQCLALIEMQERGRCQA